VEDATFKPLTSMPTRAKVGTNKWLRRLYRFLNKEFFKNKLPRIPVEWGILPGNRLARVLWTKPKTKGEKPKPYLLQIRKELKPKYLQKQVGFCILHEMGHIKLGYFVDCEDWGGEFDKLMFDLAKRGAFRYFW